MSWKLTQETWGAPMTSTDKLVLLCLADHASEDGVAFPGIARMAERCGLTERCVTQVLRRLEDQGYISVSETERGTRSRRYRVHPTPEPRSPLTPELDSPLNVVRPEPRSARGERRSARGEPRSPESLEPVLTKKLLQVPPRARRCPPGFELTTERFEYAVGKGLAIADVGEEFERFRDYEFRTPKSDWDACWRTWARKAVEIRGAGRSRSGYMTAAEKTAEAFANVRAKYALLEAK